MGRRQQRSPNFRGQVQVQNIYPRNTLATTIEIPDDTHIDLIVPPGSPDLIITGLPALTSSVSGNEVTACALITGGVRCTLGIALAAGEAVRMPPGDPAVRTADGLFLAPVYVEAITIPYPSPGIPVSEWGGAISTPDSILVEFVENVAAMAPNLVWYSETKAEFCVSVAIETANSIRVTFPNLLDAGDLITYPESCPAVVLDDLTIPVAKTIPFF